MNGREAMGRLAQRVKASMGRYRLVWLVILAGLILLLLPTGEKEGEAREETEQTQSAFDLAATEARLSQALSKIHGAGEVTVVLTVANGPRQILAENVDRDGSQGEEKTETVVLSRGSGSQETVTVQEIYPRYQGALLVCAGGDDPTVRLQLTEAMSALTGLGADKISISQGKTYETLETQCHRRGHRPVCLWGGLVELELFSGHCRWEKPGGGGPGGQSE